MELLALRIINALPNRLLVMLSKFLKLRIIRFLVAAIVGSINVLTFTDLALKSNGTMYGIDLTELSGNEIMFTNVLDKMPSCEDIPDWILHDFVKRNISDDDLETSLDSLIDILSDNSQAGDHPAIIICLASLLIILFTVNKSRFRILLRKLWEAYKAGRLSKSRYLAIVRLLRRKSIMAPF